MSGLTDAERAELRRVVFPAHYDDPNLDMVADVVEAIVARAVNEALEDAAELIGQFDPTDNYHGSDYQEPGYYSALSRAEALLLGHISDWRDLGPAARAT